MSLLWPLITEVQPTPATVCKWNTFNTDGYIEHRVHIISQVCTVANVQRIGTHMITWYNRFHCVWHFGWYIFIIFHKGLSKLTFRKMSDKWKTSHHLRNFIEINILIYWMHTDREPLKFPLTPYSGWMTNTGRWFDSSFLPRPLSVFLVRDAVV